MVDRCLNKLSFFFSESFRKPIFLVIKYIFCKNCPALQMSSFPDYVLWGLGWALWKPFVEYEGGPSSCRNPPWGHIPNLGPKAKKNWYFLYWTFHKSFKGHPTSYLENPASSTVDAETSNGNGTNIIFFFWYCTITQCYQLPWFKKYQSISTKFIPDLISSWYWPSSLECLRIYFILKL